MKRSLFPPSVREKEKVIQFLDQSCEKTRCSSHYQFLKKTKEAGFAAWGMISLGFATFPFSDFPIAQLFLLALGFYIVIYAYRTDQIMEAFHMDHLENLNERALDQFLSQSTTNTDHQAEPADRGNG